MDISKNKADICLKEHSKVLQRFIVTNDRVSISILLNRLHPYLKNNYRKKNKVGVRYLIKAAIEPTGNLWINMYEALECCGINRKLANPLKTRAIAETRIKYDKIGVDSSFWEHFLHYLMGTPKQYLSSLFARLLPLSPFVVPVSILI
jgi:hypothetical protein